jgi:hypothetical protein
MAQISANEESYTRPFALSAGSFFRQSQPLVLQLWVCAEVDQDAQFKIAGMEVIDHLGFVLVDQFAHSFDFNDDSSRSR